MPTARAKAAFRFLLANNSYYKAYTLELKKTKNDPRPQQPENRPTPVCGPGISQTRFDEDLKLCEG